MASHENISQEDRETFSGKSREVFYTITISLSILNEKLKLIFFLITTLDSLFDFEIDLLQFNEVNSIVPTCPTSVLTVIFLSLVIMRMI